MGKGVGMVGVEEGVVVHVAGQWQAVGWEGAGEEVEVRQQVFPRVRRAPRLRRVASSRMLSQTCLSGPSGRQACGLAAYCQSAP